MQARISIAAATVKALRDQLAQARVRADQQLYERCAALLLFAHRQPVADIARLLGIAESSFYNWLRALLLGGVAGLRPHTAPGRKPKLTSQQKSRLRELLVAGPENSGFACGGWNAALVQTLIEREFKVLYNQRYVCALLAGLGFSYQKAHFVAAQRDDAARQTWLEALWPKIAQEALAQDAWLLFGDEASFAWWGSLGYTWAPRGQQPELKTSGRRKGYKVFGMLEWFSGQMFWSGHDGRFNAHSYCAFIAELLAKSRQHLIIIQDGARYHTAAYTRAWLAEQAARVTVYQLPSYSPDFNPIEHVWRYVKEGTHNSYFATFGDVARRVEERLQQLLADPARVQQLMGTPLDALIGMAPLPA